MPRAVPVAVLGGATAKGPGRDVDEDAFLVRPDVACLAVLDGLGGHPDGEVASALARDRLDALLTSVDDEEAAARQAHEVVVAAHCAVVEAPADGTGTPGMGTTVVLARLLAPRADDTGPRAAAGRALVAHVGDSRALVVRDGRVRQVTADHTSGGYLLQALGLGQGVEVATTLVDLHPGDALVLATDGVTNPLAPEELADVVASCSAAGGQAAAEALVAAAHQADGHDDATAVVALL